MNIDIITKAIKLVTSVQTRYDGNPIHPEKVAAKKRACDLITDHLGITNYRVLDIGGEDFYHYLFRNIESYNLPNDMHEMAFEAEYEAIMMMHVLEHSPFPLLPLMLAHDAVVHNGIVYIAVPKPTEPFISDPNHFSVLPIKMWTKLIALAGFEIVHQETGRFNNYKAAIEERFVCRRR